MQPYWTASTIVYVLIKIVFKRYCTTKTCSFLFLNKIILIKLKDTSTYLFTVFELPHDTIVIPLCDTLRITNGALDEGFEATLEQLIHLVVIVIVVPNAEHALYVVPDRSSEA